MSILDELKDMVDSLTPGQRAALAELLRASVQENRRDGAKAEERDEPIAIIGMAGRFPGARNLEELWSLLAEGRDAISEVPAQRWSAEQLYDPERSRPGTSATRWGGFVDDVELFDAEFFGITPREAESMDPQQRLFLETTWTALEHAGLPPSSLSGAAAGIFVGVSNVDYLWHQFSDLTKVDAYASSGSSHCIIANRISYLLNLTGPSLAVDTACSSSLVAVHLACQSLRNRECELAVAGGVNLLLTPHLFVSLSDWGMMAKDGRCKTFDARADGFVRGEGCGAIVVKRLADADRDGDRVLAVIRGSAVNQDGRTNGLTAPSASAQQAVMRQALVRAGASPGQLSYLETHGTGTSLGDPIEIEAISELFGGAGSCVLGALKTNIGHLESAAGIAGLIKVVLALEHGLIPRNLHYRALNPHIALARGIELATEERPWPMSSAPRLAGVSAFSFGGTNAHIILGEAPATPAMQADPSPPGPVLVPLSASSSATRARMAERHATWLEGRAEEILLSDYAALRALHRDHLDLRLAVLGDDAREIAAALRDFAVRGAHPAVTSGRRLPGIRPVFLYTGQGSQWLGMGRELIREEPHFREAVEELDEIFARVAGQRPAALLSLDEAGANELARTDRAQPAIFSLQVALTRTLAHWGIHPAAVAGHSVGEIAAAWAAGALTLEDAIRVVHHRSRLMQRATGAGAMVSATLAPSEVRPYLATRRSISLAAHNGVRSVVLAGDPDEVANIQQELEDGGVRCKRLPVDYAFHSTQMDPLRDELTNALAGLTPRPPSLPFYSTVSGQRERGLLTAAHWARNMRETVAFFSVIEQLAAEGPAYFLELGPHPALTPHVLETMEHLQRTWPGSACMRRERGRRRDLLAAVAALYVHGCDPDWAQLVRKPDRRSLSPALRACPTYPWQPRRCWIDAVETSSEKPETSEPLLYTTAWQAEPPGASSAPAPARSSYLLFSDGSELATQLRSAIASNGDRCWWVEPGSELRLGRGEGALDATNAAHLRRLAEQLGAESYLFERVILPFTASGLAGGYDDAARPVHTLRGVAQHLLEGDRRIQLAVVTRAAMATAPGAEVSGHAAAWGFCRALAHEERRAQLMMIDLPAAPEAEEAAACLARLARPAMDNLEPQVARREGQWLVARLVRPADERSGAPRFDPGGTYLVTGGLGSLGLAVAEWLIAHGVRSLALVARRAPGEEQLRAMAVLQARGAQVSALRADIADAEEARRLFAELAAHVPPLPPLRGVIHAAGVTEDGLVSRASEESFHRVLSPKLAGGWNLHLLTQGMDLTHFISFSSATAVLGVAGQTSYAAANAFLQALTEHRRSRGLPATCVHWGAWRASTMVSEDVRARLERQGFPAMTPASALAALHRLLERGLDVAAVMAADWKTVVARAGDPALDRFVANVCPADERAPAREPDGQLLAALSAAAPAQRRKALYGHVRSTVMTAMGMEPRAELRPEQGLIESGIDSMLAVNIAAQLSRDLGCRLPRTLLYDHSTLHRLTEHLLATACADPVKPAEDQPTSDSSQPLHDELTGASAATIQALLDEELASLLPI